MILLLIILAILVSGAAGILAALTGDGDPKYFRRVLVPMISTIFVLVVLRQWQLLFLMARSSVLSQGYGIPDATDKGSMLGRFWYNLLRNLSAIKYLFLGTDSEEKLQRAASIATRATLGIQECIIMSLIPIMTGHWFWFWPACAGVIWSWVYFGAIKTNEGMFKLFGHNLLWEEVEIHGINTFLYCLVGILCR